MLWMQNGCNVQFIFKDTCIGYLIPSLRTMPGLESNSKMDIMYLPSIMKDIFWRLKLSLNCSLS